MTDQREAINIRDFYDLRRRLWCDAICALLSKPVTAGFHSSYNPKTAAIAADATVAEFDKRFRSVL